MNGQSIAYSTVPIGCKPGISVYQLLWPILQRCLLLASYPVVCYSLNLWQNMESYYFYKTEGRLSKWPVGNRSCDCVAGKGGHHASTCWCFLCFRAKVYISWHHNMDIKLITCGISRTQILFMEITNLCYMWLLLIDHIWIGKWFLLNPHCRARR